VLEATGLYTQHWLSGVRYSQAAADIVLAARAAEQKSVRQVRTPQQLLELAAELSDELYPGASPFLVPVYAAAALLAPDKVSHNTTFEVMAAHEVSQLSWGACTACVCLLGGCRHVAPAWMRAVRTGRRAGAELAPSWVLSALVAPAPLPAPNPSSLQCCPLTAFPALPCPPLPSPALPPTGGQRHAGVGC
jgi:hypothetical protein